MSFVDVKHQDAAQRALQRAIARSRMPHAYIFHGPAGVGKERLARELARRLLCAQPVTRNFEPQVANSLGTKEITDACGVCEDCRLVTADTHPDLHLIYRQLNRQHPDSSVRGRKGLELYIDVVRHFLIEPAGLTPGRGRAKVFVVREADLLNDHAQNALLKTLEEPPGPAYIILLTASIDLLLPTTRSRCQVVAFGPLPTDFVGERLSAARPQLPAVEAQWYASLSGGSVGRAIEFADQRLFALNAGVARALTHPGVNGAGLAGEWLEAAKGLGESYRTADPEITDTESTRRALKTILLLVATWYADWLHVSAGRTALVNAASSEMICGAGARLTQSADPHRIVDRINRVAAAEEQLDQNANPQLCIEVLAADLAA